MALGISVRRGKRARSRKREEPPDFGKEPHYLKEYMKKVEEEMGERPELVEKIPSAMKNAKSFNIVYPVGSGIFIHALSKRGESGYSRYIVIEPPRPPKSLLDIIEELLPFAIREEVPSSSEEKKYILLEALSSVVLPTDKNVDYSKPRTKGLRVIVGKRDLDYLKYHIIRDKVGVGLLEPFLRDPYLEDITANGIGPIYVVHKMFGSMESNVGFSSERELDEFIIKLGEKIGKPLTRARPIVDATLPDGSRINIVFGSDVSLRGSNFTIRKVSKVPVSLTQLIKWGTFDHVIAAYMWMMLSEGMSVFICGESIAEGEPVIVRNRKTGFLEILRIEELEDKYWDYDALTLDPKTFKFVFRPIRGFIRHKPFSGIYEVVTRTGRRIRVTGDHSLFTVRGGSIAPISVEKLRPGDKIIVPLRTPSGFSDMDSLDLSDLFRDRDGGAEGCGQAVGIGGPENIGFSIVGGRLTSWKAKVRIRPIIKVDHEFAFLLGFLMANANVSESMNSVWLSPKNLEGSDIVSNLIRRIYGVEARRLNGRSHRIVVKSKVFASIIEALGIANEEHYRRLPGFIFGLKESKIASFLLGFIAGSKHVEVVGDVVKLGVGSRSLLHGLPLLLHALGIVTIIELGKPGRESFLEIKLRDLNKLVSAAGKSSDLFCKTSKKLCEAVRGQSRSLAPAASENHYQHHAGGMGLLVVEAYAARAEPEELGDVFLDEVIEVKPCCERVRYVYDLSVPGTENFVAGLGGVLAHNTASGKTTSLNAISAFIRPTAKIVTIEDTAEVVLPHPNWTRELTRDTGKAESSVTMFDLLRAALRQRPNYIIVGEIRGAEGNIAFQAMQTGHPVMATFHAANLERLIQRLTNHPINVPKTNIDNLNIAWFQSAVYVKGFPARRVLSINEIIGYDPDSGAIAAVPVFTWDPVTDRFMFSGRGSSYLLEEKIAVMRGIPRRRIGEIYEELDLRARFLKLLAGKGVLDYFDVYKAIVKAYSIGVEEAYRLLQQDRLL